MGTTDIKCKVTTNSIMCFELANNGKFLHSHGKDMLPCISQKMFCLFQPCRRFIFWKFRWQIHVLAFSSRHHLASIQVKRVIKLEMGTSSRFISHSKKKHGQLRVLKQNTLNTRIIWKPNSWIELCMIRVWKAFQSFTIFSKIFVGTNEN